MHFLLVADDLGNCEASGPFIRRRLLGGAQTPDETIAKMLAELQDADLIRIYLIGLKRYVHIPRFRQRLRSFKRVNPRPPSGVECAEIKEIADKMSDNSQSHDRHLTDTRQTLAGEGRKEGSEGRKLRARDPTPVDNSGRTSRTGRNIAHVKGHSTPPGMTVGAAAGKAIGITAYPGESTDAFTARVKAMKATARKRARETT